MLARTSLTLLLFAGLGRAETPDNTPSECPYCAGDAERMARAGIRSHGGFQFAAGDTNSVDAFLGTSDVRWIETEHFEIGLALGTYKLRQKEKKKVRAELTELQKVLPEINPKAKTLDPWLRVHLYAQRLEQFWERFLEVLGVRAQDFPAGAGAWVIGTPYMGEGPYVGQKGKFELLALPSEAVHVDFLRDQFGLSIRRTQRWNIPDRDTLITVMHTGEGELRNDQALHNHVVFNATINMLDGYKHYSYETPIWLREGLAHYLEREISPDFNSFDSAEGGVAETTRKSDWEPPVRRMIQGGDAPRLAEMINLKSYAELELKHHYATWSMTAFMVEAHGEGYACLTGGLHGRKNDKGFADGSNMRDVHRKLFHECFGMTYPEFDAAWSAWALAK